MTGSTAAEHPWFEESVRSERPRLVRLCTAITGNSIAAEDLAQETVLEAWRQRHKIYDPAGLPAWLAAIARNVCRRWAQVRSQTPSDVDTSHVDAAAIGMLSGESASLDLELELERDEMARLLDQALALLPGETRAVLIARLIDNLPHAQIAQQLRLSEGAVKMRLKRGKLALRQVLVSEFADQIRAHSIGVPSSARQPTTIWCPLCGMAKLEVMLDRERGDFTLTCPTCFPAHGVAITRVEADPNLLGGLQGYMPMLNRITRIVVPYFRDARATSTGICLRCGAPSRVVMQLPAPYRSRPREQRGMQVVCPSCGEVVWISAGGFIMADPAVQDFWREHPRMRTWPERSIEVDGRPALVARLESVTRAARLDVLVDAEDFTILSTHRL
jgi:RNA polymerase sigma-70 factor (ECF subfamily)